MRRHRSAEEDIASEDGNPTIPLFSRRVASALVQPPLVDLTTGESVSATSVGQAGTSGQEEASDKGS